jgi:hypothetical protein
VESNWFMGQKKIIRAILARQILRGEFMVEKNMHTIMPKKLAQALMEASVKHFDVGGSVTGPLGGGTIGQLLGNNTYSASAPGIQTQNFGTEIGVGQDQQQASYNNQSNLANQLLAQTQGGGPAAVLNANNVGTNVANQAALAASTRGANSNPALIARQAAQAGAQAQQQGLNTAAATELQSQQALQQQQAAMAQEGLGQQQVSQNANAAQNNAITQGELGASNINANISGQNASNTGKIGGGLLNAAGSILSMFAEGGEMPFSNDYLKGGKVKGKAKVSGDSVENDTKPAMLSPGEEVIDRETLADPGPIGKAARMVAAHINAKSGNGPKESKNPSVKSAEFLRHLKGSKKEGSYKDVLDAKKSLSDRVAALERCMGGRVG